MNNGIVSPNQIKYSDESGSGTVIPLFDDPFKSSDSQLQINVSLPDYFQVGEININNANESNIETFTITAELTNGTVIDIQCEHGSFNVSNFSVSKWNIKQVILATQQVSRHVTMQMQEKMA